MESRGTVAGWVNWMRASGTPGSTISLRRYYVHRLAGDHPGRALADLDVEDLARWMGGHDWAANTRKSARSSLRSFYGWLAVFGHITTSPAHQLPAVRVPRGRPKPTPEAAYREAVACADDRASLAIRLAAQCGLRRGEIARSSTDDVEDDLIGQSLRVVGKGGHVRVVPLPVALAAEILARPDGWLFPSPHGGHLTPHYLGKLVTAQLREGSTHGLRHRCATVAYAATHDLRAVQELLGHSRPETTAGYVEAPEDSIRAAMLAAAA